MNKVIRVAGMSCDHCVKRITNAINEIEDAKCLNVSLEDNTVTVEYSDDDVLSHIEEAIEDAGYEVLINE